eukprot:4380608-Pyramimonas_sp.AAC.1
MSKVGTTGSSCANKGEGALNIPDGPFPFSHSGSSSPLSPTALPLVGHASITRASFFRSGWLSYTAYTLLVQSASLVFFNPTAVAGTCSVFAALVCPCRALTEVTRSDQHQHRTGGDGD